MDKVKVINELEVFLKSTFSGEASGHDWHHTNRVRNLSMNIASVEGGNLFVIEAASLLHDVADWKFNDDDLEAGPKKARELLSKLNVSDDIIRKVEQIIREVSFKGANVKNEVSTLEARIVQDADRIDAIGAMGIARCFAYGGSKGQEMYDPEHKVQMHGSFEEYKTAKTTSINHFYEKLLLLKDKMTTPTGKKLAEERHHFMLDFLKQFYKEWEV